MTFYEEIAPYYHQIFPLQTSQVTFVNSTFTNPMETKLLEVGSGIGLLSFALAGHYAKIVAFDLDEGMLQEAKRKMEEQSISSEYLQFLRLNMLDIGAKFENESFDGVLCFGNTLVHLESQDNVLSFLKQAKEVLKKDGVLLFQILNYDRLLDNKITSLPLIDNDHVRFERMYSYPPHSVAIEFKTILTIKKDNQIIEHTIPLLPLRKHDIEQLMILAGFEKFDLYGSYAMDPFTKDSDSIVILASRSAYRSEIS